MVLLVVRGGVGEFAEYSTNYVRVYVLRVYVALRVSVAAPGARADRRDRRAGAARAPAAARARVSRVCYFFMLCVFLPRPGGQGVRRA